MCRCAGLSHSPGIEVGLGEPSRSATTATQAPSASDSPGAVRALY